MAKDYYKILGVSPNASMEEIKSKFRALVRTYHPDVHPDKLFSHQVFRDILEAYKVLSDPQKRKEYDDSRRAKHPPTFVVEVPPRPPADVEGLLLRAEIALIRGNLKEAIELCQEVLKREPRNAFAYNLLGDIFRAQGKRKEAIEMYSYAVQFDPSKPIYAEKLTRLLQPSEELIEKRAPRFSFLLFFIGMIASFVIAFLLRRSPGEIIQNFPFSNYTLNLILALVCGGGILGFFSASSRLLRPLDEELIFSLTWIGKGYLPMGLILALFSLGSFWGSLGIYVIVSLIQETTSTSVWKAYALSFFLTLLLSFSFPLGAKSTIIWGGNFVFPSFLIGWIIGDIFRPR